MADEDDVKHDAPESGLSRRDFLKIGSITAAVPLVLGPNVVEAAGEQIPIHGPDKVPITLTINGKKQSLQVEPRVTLLDAMRNHLDVTGAKRVCDRATCGACTVLMDGRAVYSCSILAIDAQGRNITTVEALGTPDKLHPIQRAFIDNDASQCGFCTPGFIVAAKAMLDRNPKPTPEQVYHDLSGNFCRCGTYKGLRAAIAQAGGSPASTGKKGA